MSEDNPERLLIGAVLAGCHDVPGLLARVAPSDFDDHHLESIWAAIGSVVEGGGAPEVSRVATAMGRDAQRLPDGPVFLTDLFAQSRRPESAEWYAERVVDQADRRRVMQVGTFITQASTDPAYENVATILEEVRARLDAATRPDGAADEKTVATALPAVLDIAQHGHPAGLSTPWDGIDRLTRGLPRGRLIVVGGRPGGGKSVVGMNLAHHVAKVHKTPVFVASMEMSFIELTQRLVAHHAGVELAQLDSGTVSERGWAAIQRGYDEMAALPIHYDDRGTQSIASVRRRVQDMARKPDGISLVVVDYLQIMTTRDGSRNRAEQVGELSRGLKLLARDFDVPVVAMSQLNRALTQRSGGKPTLADLRESGSIEQDADIVMLLQPGGDDVEDLDEGQLRIFVEKNRSGPRGVATLDFRGHFSRISERTSWSAYTDKEPA